MCFHRVLCVLSFFAFLFLISCEGPEKEIKVASIAISQSSAEMVIGETLSLKVTVSPSNATYDGVKWSSERSEVASVSESGLVSAISEGTSTILATVGGKNASCLVTVVNGYVAVTSISLNKTSLKLLIGESETLTASVMPEDASDKAVSWTSSDNGIVTVDNNGTVEAINIGEATIIAKSGDVTNICDVVVSQGNIITYVSSDGRVVNPSNPDAFGANILSNDYSDGVGTITFDGNVTRIGECAFEGCESLSSLSIPKSATIIDSCAFAWCSSLASIEIASSVTSIGVYAFYRCPISSISIPESVVSIGRCAFYSCRALKSFNGKFATDDGLYLINDGNLIAGAIGALAGDITLPDNVTTIGSGALAFSSISGVTIPDGVTTIGGNAFNSCTGLSRVSLPNSLTSIQAFSFLSCKALTSIVLPNSLTSIGGSAFSNCTSIKEIIIPDNVSRIEMDTFGGCSSLVHVTIPNGVTSIGDMAFFSCSNLASIEIPDGVESIGESSFYGCESLVSVNFPKNLKIVGDHSFWRCTELQFVESDAITPPHLGFDVFSPTSIKSICVPEESFISYITNDEWKNYANLIITRKSILFPIPEAIDLGLPSGNKWASFNLGSSCPEEPGDYFAWGETEYYYEPGYSLSKYPIWKSGFETGYTKASYKWFRNGHYSTKYCSNESCGYQGFIDGKTTLDLEDDAAYTCLGEKWRIPSESDWIELLDYCTWEFSSLNGINGQKVTASNGNSIFLPASDIRVEEQSPDIGYGGIYWASSTPSDFPYYGTTLQFDTMGVKMTSFWRYQGNTIRPLYIK